MDESWSGLVVMAHVRRSERWKSISWNVTVIYKDGYKKMRRGTARAGSRA